jgi:hypothetical protein
MDVMIYMSGEGDQVEITTQNLIGRIDEQGNVYEVEEQDETCLGWINFEDGDVYDDEDELIGWVEDDGTVVALSEEGDEEIEIGHVNDKGELYCYTGEDEETLVGQLKNMHDYTEGAAALLFFLSFDEE